MIPKLVSSLLLPVLPICPAKPGYTNARFSWIEVLPGTEEEIVTEPSVSQYILEAGTKCPPSWAFKIPLFFLLNISPLSELEVSE